MEISLRELKVGQEGMVTKIVAGGGHGMGHGAAKRLKDMGVRIGKNVRMVASQPIGGPIVIEIDGRRTAIGRGRAAKIYVEV
ncbi:MAG: hypothetical protein A7316_10280 [Candidatus Altiarchaeales archaeon WOR_SM1_86-2]|nr:MAG: hypothetical protein A7316_10280 [Candidatus Altiarchaeales archaeon WOR_SM1_86-2]